MTGYERMSAAHRGDPVDRVPIWLREGFEICDPLPAKEDFLNGWKQSPEYLETLEYVRPHIDLVKNWGVGEVNNRFLMIPPGFIKHESTRIEGNLQVQIGSIKTAKRDLPFKRVWKKHNNNGWMIDPPVSSVEELKMVADIHFDLDTDTIERHISSYAAAKSKLGDRGVLRLSFSSPIVAISGLMTLELFLELSYSERSLFHALLEKITERNLAVVEAVFNGRDFDTTVSFGGSEQCTPPLMHPAAFDELVVPYDGPIIRRIKSLGMPVNVHCHGKVRRALGCMIDMGVDSTDPVEPPPAGDVTFSEARDIAGDDLTIVGNLEWNEFLYLNTHGIRRRVEEICAFGSRRLILSASAGPNTYINGKVAANIRAFVEAGLEFGR